MTRFKTKFAMTDDRSGVTEEDIGDWENNNTRNISLPHVIQSNQDPTVDKDITSKKRFSLANEAIMKDYIPGCPSLTQVHSVDSDCLENSTAKFTVDNQNVHLYDSSEASAYVTMSRFSGDKSKTCRDPPVMESCETRTVIEPDKKLDAARLRRNSEDRHYVRNEYSTTNYFFFDKERCTELFTTLMMLASMTISTLLGNIVWKNSLDNNYHRHHHHRHHVKSTRNSNCIRTFSVSVLAFLVYSSSSMIKLVHGQPPPLPPAGFLDFDNLPVTRFSCEGKVIGGYYADVETGCQMFHVCTLGQKDEIQDIKFLCLNGTVFDQETRVCERVDEVDCTKAEQFFDLNLDLYVPHATTPKPEDAADLEEEDDIIRPVKATSAKPKPPQTTTTTTTRATTTTTTPTPSPRTRPPTSPRSRSPPVISSSSSSSQQVEEEEDEDGENGNNAYTSFNYYLKTPHSHVASGYNSQSRQSYLINNPHPGSGRSNSGSSGKSSSSSNSATAATSSTGRKVPSGPGHKTIVYTSSSTSSSSTQRPKTVVVVKATLPPSKSILKPKTLATPIRTTTTTSTTPLPSPKYELDDSYDYYEEDDYNEQPPAPASSSSKQSSFQPTYPVNKPALTSSSSAYDFRDGRSTKGIANAGQTIVSSTTGKSAIPSSKVSVSQTSIAAKASIKPVSTPIKIGSTQFLETNSTEETPYYYEDDYEDDDTLQQKQQEQEHYRNHYASTSASSSSSGRGSSSFVPSTSPSSSSNSKSKSTSSSSLPVSNPSSSNSRSPSSSTNNQNNQNVKNANTDKSSSQEAESFYYDDDDTVASVAHAHDHHFTHVDVPRIPYAKPNVPRVLVTNGKPFLPRLRRQSHHHLYYSSPPQQSSSPAKRQHEMQKQETQPSSQNPHFLLPSSPSSSPPSSRSFRRSLTDFFRQNEQSQSQPPSHSQQNHPRHLNQPPPPTQHTHQNHLHHPNHNRKLDHVAAASELRQEARAKARQWGRDQFR